MALTNEELNDLYDMTEGRCFYCGMRLSFCNYGDVGMRGAWEADHFIPFSRRGLLRTLQSRPSLRSLQHSEGGLDALGIRSRPIPAWGSRPTELRRRLGEDDAAAHIRIGGDF